MEFTKATRLTYREIAVKDYFDGQCPFCGSEETILRSSRVRTIQELGSPNEQVQVRLTVATVQCKSCRAEWTPEHPDYPPKFEYSKAVITYALTRYHYQNASGLQIARDLALLHHVRVPEATVYTWLKRHSPEFIKTHLDADPTALPRTIKAISLDGTYFTTGKDIIGKKKHVDSLSVTQLKDGRYLLMWWE